MSQAAERLDEEPLPGDEEALAAQMAEMARAAEQAAAFLGELASAFFPSGGDVRAMTWADQESSGNSAGGDTQSIEARLRAAEARFRTLVEQIPAVTFMAVLGEGQNEVYVSPHIETMLGFTQKEWLENPFLWYWQLHPDDRAMWNEEFARGCRTGGPFRAECRFHARDGHEVWVHGEARVVKDDRGRPAFLQGVAFDITETKRAQEVLLRDAVSQAKAEEELAIARRVQTSILPRDLRVPGLSVATAMIPAEEVGGDYFDVLPEKDGAWLAIGDVSGHGLPAGLVMLMVQSAVAALTRARPHATPKEMVLLLNEVVFDNIRQRVGGDDHVTFTLFRYWQDGQMLFSGAHEDILIHRKAKGRVEVVHTPGTWVGARRNVGGAMVDTPLELAPGDVLLLYTDGVTEARARGGEQFDLPRLIAALEELHDQDPQAIVDGILARVKHHMHHQEDDISLLVARYGDR